MSAPAITDELLTLADAIGDVKTRFEKLEAEFSTQARPLEAAATALQASLAGIKALQFHVIDNNLGALSQRVEEQRRAVDEQIGVIVTELRKADDDNRTTLGASKEELAQQIAGLQTQIGQLHTRFSAELDRVQLEAKSKVEALALLPGPQGAQGASVKPRGAYDQNTAYSKLEIVSWMGGSYISNADDNREKPGAKAKNWTMLASRGGPGGGSGDITGLTGVALPAQIVSGASTYTVGDILYANSTGTLAKLPAGSANLVLKSNGAGSAPAWAATTDSVAATAAEAAAGTSDSVFVTPATGALAAANAVNPRAPAQGLVFDGSQTAGGLATLGSSIGTSAFSRVDVIDCPSSNPSAIRGIGTFSSSTSAATTVNGWEWYINTSGELVCTIYGAALTDYYRATVAGFVTAYAGKRVALACVRSTSGDLVLYANGVALTVTTSTGGTNPTAQGSITSTYAHVGITGASNQYPFSGYVRQIGTENRALTAAEVLALYESGAPAAGDYNNASNTAITGRGVYTGAEVQGGATADAFRVIKNGTSYAVSTWNSASRTPATIAKDSRWLVTGTLTLNNGKTQKPSVYLDNLVSSPITAITVASGSAFAVEVVSPGSVTSSGLAFVANGDHDYSISGLAVYPLGLLLAPEANAPGNGYQWKDMSGNKANITLPTTGVAWALPDRRPNSVRGTLTWAGSSEWKTVIGQRSLPNDAVITLLTLRGTANTTGSGTKVSSNNTDGRWSAAAAISANTKVVRTLANQLPAGTADADCDIAVDPDTNNYTGSIEIEAFYSLSQ
jgi:hypothetical protein